MKTAEEILEQEGFHYLDTFNNILTPDGIEGSQGERLIRAMKAYATMAIEEQKRLCLKNADIWCDIKGYYFIDNDSILNAPNVELR